MLVSVGIWPTSGTHNRTYVSSDSGMEVHWWVLRYAMREALALVGEEGLPAMWARHQRMHEQLWAGLTEMGLEPFVENPDERLITVNTIKVPHLQLD